MEENKELLESLGKKTNELLEAHKADHKQEVEKLAKELRTELGPDSEAWKNLKSQLDEIQVDMKKAVQYKAEEGKPMQEQLKDALNSKDFAEAKKANKAGHNTPYIFELKADDITNSNSITGTIPAPFIVPGISESPYRMPFLRDIVSVFNTTSPTIYWYEETARTDGSAMTAEAAVYGQGDQTWEQKSIAVKKVTEYMKYSDEMFNDNAYLSSAMNNKLFKDLGLKIDVQQLSGTGAGNNIYGIDSYATAYSAPTGLSGNVDSPTYFDILLAGLTQVSNAYFQSSYFVLNPTNVAQLMSIKTTDAAYSTPPWVSINNGRLSIMGVPVISNTGVTVNEFYVGDFSKVNLAVRQDIQVRVWDQNSTDPIYGMNTITATARIGQFVSGQDTAAIVKGDLNATNLAALSNA